MKHVEYDTIIYIGNQEFIVNPTDDLTPIESLRISQLLLLISFGYTDTYEFVQYHNLMKHFSIYEGD